MGDMIMTNSKLTTVRLIKEGSPAAEHSALEAIHGVAQRYSRVGKTLHLTRLSHECREMFQNTREMISFEISDEPQHHVSTDRFSNVESTIV